MGASEAPAEGPATGPAAAARAACEKYGLNVLDAPVVEQMMHRPESCWAPCCNGGCIPCNDEYAAAARLGQRLVREAEVPETVVVSATAAAKR